MKKTTIMRGFAAYVLALWLVLAQQVAYTHALEHKAEGYVEACSLCLDAAQFAAADIPPASLVAGLSTISESIVFEEYFFIPSVSFSPYTSRAPPVQS